jgi:hypothetical protein
MPNKTQEYLNLAQQTAKELTRHWENWTDYLTTASRLYKYSYADQLMIYAQRPDATACASFDLWNNRMNRYIRRGSKGIALLDQSSSVPRLHYVFDVSDTGVRRNSRDPDMWQLGPDLVQPVSEMLVREYGVQHENLSQQIADICGKLVDSYWDNNSGDILDIVDGSLLMGYDEAGQEFQFKSAAAISITYTVLERCGFEPNGHFDRDDFQAIFAFSTPAAVYALGTAVSECSRDVLRNIERTVKTTIRRRNIERSQYEYEQQERDLLDHRGLPAPEPDLTPAGESTGQIRQTAQDLPDEASSGAVQLDAPVGNSASAPTGSGADRREPDAADHAGTAETEPDSEQGAASDGVGAAHEQPESTGRGTGDERADLQLSFFDTHIPTEAEQIESIDRAENEKSSSAFSLSQADIENALRRGSNFENSKLRIWKIYQLQSDRKLRAKALAKEYAPYGRGGSSHTYLDGSSGWLDHDSKGLTFEHYPDHQKTLLRWNQVEKYIDLMIQSDRYLTDKEKRAIEFPLQLNDTSAAEYTALKEQYPDALIGFEAGGNFMFYGEDAAKVAKIINSALFTRNTALGEVQITGFLPSLWAKRAKELWSAGNDVYLAGLNEDGTHHQTKHLRKEDYLPIGSIINMDGREFRVDNVDFGKGKVSLQDMALADARMPIFREEPLSVVRELYEQQDEALDAAPEKAVDYKVGDSVVVDLPTKTIEGTIGYVGETDVRIDTSAQGYSWSNEVLNKAQFENNLRQVEPESTPDEELDKLPISAEVNGEWQTFPDAAAADETLNAEPVPEAAGNFHITDEHLGEGGAKQKYARNIEAIRTLFQLEQEHRGATAEEQEVLSQYVGWGGLADAFDPDKGNWTKEYSELKSLLSEEEYAAARASTLNAHYTSPTVIRAIYDAVEKMGFRSGNILEPSMGIGNFFGMLPDTMQDSRLYGVELDSVTGRIAQKLYPEANIKVAGFETTDRRDFYDLAVGNVPFGQYKVNDKAYNKLNFSIHNYFFAKAIFNWRKLKDGTPVFGYQCNMRTVNPTRSFVMEHNLTDQLSCDAISIPEWKLELMAKKIFEKVWGDQNKAILRACQMLESCQNSHSTAAMSAVPIQSKIEKIKKRKLNYGAMRADGELEREEYQALCKQADDEIARLEKELQALTPAPETQSVSTNMKAIRDFLEQKVDVHGACLAPELIDQFVEVVTPIGDYTYRWKLNTGRKKSKDERTDLMAVTDSPILAFTIDFETAKRYREANKMPHQFRRAAWTDLTVEVYL